ncbi:MAG: 1-acyl-sn-glycerol-3-phosphate acyltransferase [Acidobacteria bacterium]|nr:1-acyl-sn-glycerol-3-phosphate acyltransferase [Acidobacteriota bacterium]
MATLRFWFSMFVGLLLAIFLGIPSISFSWLMLKLFRKEDVLYPFAKLGARIFARSAGARITVRGREWLDPKQTYLFMSNHQSNVDPPLNFAHVGHNVGVLAKKEVFKLPILKQGFPLVHVIPVDRSNREAAHRSTQFGVDKLRSGHSLLVYPEGTRSFDGKLKDLKKGVFLMGLRAGVPIVPVVLNDTRLVMRRGETKCHAHDVELIILPPISTKGHTEENVDALIAEVREAMLPHIKTD